MSFETYHPIMQDLQACLRPQRSLSFTFEGEGLEGATRLFLTGETS